MKKYLTLAFIALAAIASLSFVLLVLMDESAEAPAYQDADSSIEVSASLEEGVKAKQLAFESSEPEYPDQDKIIYSLVNGRFEPELHPADAQLWDIVVSLAPTPKVLDLITEFSVFYDTEDTTLASVAAIDDRNKEWSFEINYISVEDFDELVPTIVHEYAHILSLQDTQTDVEVEVAGINDSCTNLLVSEGCLKANTYLNDFYIEFWKDTDNYQGDVERSPQDAESFYEDRQDQFINDYATTNVIEDFAESFRVYVLEDQEGDTDIKSQKVSFFADYPAITSYRLQARAAISNWAQ